MYFKGKGFTVYSVVSSLHLVNNYCKSNAGLFLEPCNGQRLLGVGVSVDLWDFEVSMSKISF